MYELGRITLNNKILSLKIFELGMMTCIFLYEAILFELNKEESGFYLFILTLRMRIYKIIWQLE